MSVISIINQKGGCGKTTTSLNLAATLAFQEKNVLLIDFDPQGHSSLGLGIDENRIKYSILDAINGEAPIETATIPLNQYLSVLPSNVSLASLEQTLSGIDGREFALQKAIAEYKNDFDFILIDCPPHLGLLSINALLASDKIIIPVEPSKFGLDGLQKLEHTIEILCQKAKHKLETRYLLSLFDIDSDFANSFARKMQRDFGEHLFNTKIHRSSVIREATHAGKAIVDFDQHSVSFIDFMSLAQEVMVWENQAILEKIVVEGNFQPQQTPLGTCFMLQNKQARSVQISGSFNDWIPENTPLAKTKDGLWYTILPLHEGQYEYQYVIDGRYTPDPNNPEQQTSKFGVTRSVVEIK